MAIKPHHSHVESDVAPSLWPSVLLWLSALYILGITVVAGVAGFAIFFILPSLPILDPDNPYPEPIKDIIPYDVGNVISDIMIPLNVVFFFVLFVILPLQLPGWLAIWGAVCKLQSLSEGIKVRSLIVLRRVAWAAAVAYLWAITGIGGAICGFYIHLAILNPDFIWIRPENVEMGHILLIIGKILWLPAMIALIQSPGWLGLWWLNRPPIPDDPRWRKRAVIYLKWSAALCVIVTTVYLGLQLYEYLETSERELDIIVIIKGLFFLILAVLVTISIILFAQLLGWLVLAWLERRQRPLARIVNPPIEPLRLLQGAAIGYLAMITAAWITWWFRLEYVGNHDFEDMLTPYLTPVLDGLLWAQIPGWIAFLLWLVLWLNQKRRAS